MTVGELKEKLKEYNDDVVVCIPVYDEMIGDEESYEVTHLKETTEAHSYVDEAGNYQKNYFLKLTP